MGKDRTLKEICNEMGIVLTDEMVKQFAIYQTLLLEWNEKMNLTAITEKEEIAVKHFADSLSICQGITLKEGMQIIDVGTGAGFPGIPLKIAFPFLNVTLLDSLQKRIFFLEEVIKELKLKEIACFHLRAEEGGKKELLREKFDVCASRAVANLSVLCEYCLPFVKVGGYFISLKGPEVEKELAESEYAIKVLGGSLIEVKRIHIPHSELSHTLIMIKKVLQTPTQYPRKAGKVTKAPIKE